MLFEYFYSTKLTLSRDFCQDRNNGSLMAQDLAYTADTFNSHRGLFNFCQISKDVCGQR